MSDDDTGTTTGERADVELKITGTGRNGAEWSVKFVLTPAQAERFMAGDTGEFQRVLAEGMVKAIGDALRVVL